MRLAFALILCEHLFEPLNLIFITILFYNRRMGCTLHHGHNHNHSHSEAANASHENINVRAAFIHVVSDFVQSCGVFIAALVIYFRPDLTIIDPICTFLFSVLVLVTTLSIMKDALLVSFFYKFLKKYLIRKLPKIKKYLTGSDGRNSRIFGLHGDFGDFSSN